MLWLLWLATPQNPLHQIKALTYTCTPSTTHHTHTYSYPQKSLPSTVPSSAPCSTVSALRTLLFLITPQLLLHVRLSRMASPTINNAFCHNYPTSSYSLSEATTINPDSGAVMVVKMSFPQLLDRQKVPSQLFIQVQQVLQIMSEKECGLNQETLGVQIWVLRNIMGVGRGTCLTLLTLNY